MAEKDIEYEQYTPQTSGRLFNSAMFGFNKEEVLEYLEDLADENLQRQEAADHQIQELNKRIQSLEASLAQNTASKKTVDQVKSQAELIKSMTSQLEIAKAATQQSEDELHQVRESLRTMQQENAWLREEYQKSDREIAELRRQLDSASSGDWSAAQNEIEELKRQLQEASSEDWEAAQEEIEDLKRQLDEALSEAEWEEDDQEDPIHLAASAILSDAQDQAERIRREANAEKDRLHRQILNSAGGLAESITNLRFDISDVEGEVSDVLQQVQNALSDIILSLGRTEQNLSTLGIQAERFPSTSPTVPRTQQVVYFQPSPQQSGTTTLTPSLSKNKHRAPLGNNEFRRVDEDSTTSVAGNLKPFRPSYSSSSPATAYQLETYEQSQPEHAPAQEERLRELSESLVDTLVKMMTGT